VTIIWKCPQLMTSAGMYCRQSQSQKIATNSYSLCSATKNPGDVQTTFWNDKPRYATFCYLVPTLDSSKISELTPPITIPVHSMSFEPVWGVFPPDDSETAGQNQVSLESSWKELSNDVHAIFWGQIIVLSSYFEGQMFFHCGTEGYLHHKHIKLCFIKLFLLW